jgi:hypothetical protein
MSNETDSARDVVVGEALLRDAIVTGAQANAYAGMLAVISQTGIRVQTDAGSWPLPDGDYVVLMLRNPSGEAPRCAWLRTEPDSANAEPETAAEAPNATA